MSSPMKPARFRPSLPTVTSFSGISNYRTESYRPIRYKNPVPAIDYVAVSKIHFIELSFYLAAYLADAEPNSRSITRQKLTRLTIKEFHELSTDFLPPSLLASHYVAVPFLPFREEFHPKRNQARQKLATLSITRFEKFTSYIYLELNRRYPEFKESYVITLFRLDLPMTSFPSHRKHVIALFRHGLPLTSFLSRREYVIALFCFDLQPTSFPSHRELYVITLFRHELLLISFRFYSQVESG
ncbi:hypothetical protein DFH07DRAFT_954735 [Mycena maculata]|uniref:GIT Spa2 homology (SHD) domain-containing protein n=1 Tax=Mycena maculata TaxID=230809 RepID=A0AAD7NNH1_9AGAR|nr:hypothetical protein DFH07DRAFT_954735 [Mycena maculata]